jgi:esterase/lipase
MGAAMALHAMKWLETRDIPPIVLILVSAFTSIQDLSSEKTYGSIRSPMIFDNLFRIKSITVPCFFLHGTKDDLVPYQHSEKLFHACGSYTKHLRFLKSIEHNVPADMILEICQEAEKVLTELQCDIR